MFFDIFSNFKNHLSDFYQIMGNAMFLYWNLNRKSSQIWLKSRGDFEKSKNIHEKCPDENFRFFYHFILTEISRFPVPN